MTDQLPRDLTSLFDSTATNADVPPLPLSQVLAEGRALQRVRRRRTAVWTAAAAAVAVVAVTVPIAVSAHHADDRPAPAHHDQTPSPDSGGVPSTPTTLPYLDGKVLHVGDRQIRLNGNPGGLRSVGDTTFYVDQNTQQWWRVRTTRGDEVEPVGQPWGGNKRPWQGWFPPMPSPDGRTFAVLTHPTQDTSRITTFDADSEKEIDHVDLDEPFANWTGGGDSVVITSVTDSGQVVWYTSERAMAWWIWSPDTKEPVRLQPGLEVDANGLVQTGPPNGAIAAGGQLVTFSSTGQMQPLSGVPAGFDPVDATWSASGAVVATDNAAGPQITDLGGSEPVRPPTEFTILQWFAFESDAYVVGAAAVDNVPSLVRCATDRSACAVISKLPADWQSWRWAASPPSGTEQP